MTKKEFYIKILELKQNDSFYYFSSRTSFLKGSDVVTYESYLSDYVFQYDNGEFICLKNFNVKNFVDTFYKLFKKYNCF